MRILHVTTFLQGGAGRMIAALATAQRRLGHDVIVVGDSGGAPGYGSYPEYLDQLARADIPFHAIASIFTRDIALNVQAAVALRAITESAPVDVAHTHAAIPSMVARLALAGPRHVPIVQTMHGWGINKTPAQSATDINVMRLVDCVVTPSAAARDTLLGLGLSDVPVHVVPYGIARQDAPAAIDSADAPLFDRLRSEGRRVAMCIGTLGERKNQRLLVEGLSAPSLPNVDAVFIGDGDAATLLAAARECNVASRVHVLGYRADASRYLACADLLVLPSRNEGLPIAVLEALRAGVPVVGSAIPEIAEALDGAGFLFEGDSPSSLAKALSQALTASRVDTGRFERLRRMFLERYEETRMVDAYARLYAELR